MRIESDIEFISKLIGLGASNIGSSLSFDGNDFGILTPGAAGTVVTSGGTNAALTYTTPSGGGGDTYSSVIDRQYGVGGSQVTSLPIINTSIKTVGDEFRFNDQYDTAWVYRLAAGDANHYKILNSITNGTNLFTLSAAHGEELEDREPVILTTKDGVLPAELVEGTIYYIDSYTPGAMPTFKLGTSPGIGDVTITDDGTGDIYVLRQPPDRFIWPLDWWPGSGAEPAVNNKLWVRKPDYSNQYWTMAVVLDGATLTATDYYAIRPSSDDDIIGWGIVTQGPEVAPGSGDTIAAVYDLKTTPHDSATLSAVVTPRSLSIGINAYWAADFFIKNLEVIARNTGEGVWLNVSNIGDSPPDYVEVHLLMEKVKKKDVK